MILLDNNFRTVVAAVEEGRVIFENIRKVVAYTLSNSFAEVLAIFGAMLLGWPTPLLVSVLFGLLLAIGVFFVPALRNLLDITPLTIGQWGIVFAIAMALLMIVEAGKWFSMAERVRQGHPRHGSD